MFVKQKKGEDSRNNQRISVKLTIIYLLLILLFATLIIFL
jgi:hypothetical protein